MLKINISDSSYNIIVVNEEPKRVTAHSYLYKLMMQQQTQILTSNKTAQYKENQKEVLNNLSSLYIHDIIQTMYLLSPSACSLPLRASNENASVLLVEIFLNNIMKKPLLI